MQNDDDPASANWGSGWRTPSKEQWDELLSNTALMWTTQNGKEGYLFTSKENDQSVFLPVSEEEPSHVGRRGFYWSRSLYTSYPVRAWALVFFSRNCRVDYSDRTCVFSVRPVCQK